MKRARAPIVLFVYNRPWHTKQTIEALQKNELAKESELYIYSDAPKDTKAEKEVGNVREFIENVEGFKKVTIVKRERNLGLAASIIDGVTTVVNRYGKVIVLEDDLVTSPYFLSFMNDALDFYEDEKRVWHISGWNYPIDPNGLDDTFLWRVMNCWGWATWADRWKYYEKNTERVMESFSSEDIVRFNLDGAENFWSQVEANRDGKIDTWAIYWYAKIFENGGLCLNPVVSFVDNIGLDGSGIHCGISEKIECTVFGESYKIGFNKRIMEDVEVVDRIKQYFAKQKSPLWKRAVNKLFRMAIGRNILK